MDTSLHNEASTDYSGELPRGITDSLFIPALQGELLTTGPAERSYQYHLDLRYFCFSLSPLPHSVPPFSNANILTLSQSSNRGHESKFPNNIPKKKKGEN